MIYDLVITIYTDTTTNTNNNSYKVLLYKHVYSCCRQPLIERLAEPFTQAASSLTSPNDSMVALFWWVWRLRAGPESGDRASRRVRRLNITIISSMCEFVISIITINSSLELVLCDLSGSPWVARLSIHLDGLNPAHAPCRRVNTPILLGLLPINDRKSRLRRIKTHHRYKRLTALMTSKMHGTLR